MSAHISESRISNLRKMAEAVTERWPSRNVSAEDLGLPLTSPLRSGGYGSGKPGLESSASPTQGTEFNEEDSPEGPDPHDCAVESEMELEARNGDQRGN